VDPLQARADVWWVLVSRLLSLGCGSFGRIRLDSLRLLFLFAVLKMIQPLFTCLSSCNIVEEPSTLVMLCAEGEHQAAAIGAGIKSSGAVP